jgi:uncharacterized protein
MHQSRMYHDGSRRLQISSAVARFQIDWRRRSHARDFTHEDKAFIESLSYFFLATADAAGQPDCSYKGGMPGFVRVTGPSGPAFPDYDGNGMFKSSAQSRRWNIVSSPCTVTRGASVLAARQVNDRDPLLCQTVGAQLIVRVAARTIFPNCPRYIPTMQLTEPSIHPPRAGHEAPEPAWKSFPDFKDYVHPRQPTLKGDRDGR